MPEYGIVRWIIPLKRRKISMYKHLTKIRERDSGFRFLNSVKISFSDFPARAHKICVFGAINISMETP